MQTIDEYVVQTLATWCAREARGPVPARVPSERTALLDHFGAQVQSRHLDLAMRWLQSIGEGFYTIASAGHEANAAVALALRPTDPALLHYRSGAFYAARAHQAHRTGAIEDVLLGAMAAVDDPISGGRHKVFGNKALHVIPQTSTIASHLPRAVGMAFALGRATGHGEHPADTVVVCSFGDASANHSTARGALNAAGFAAHAGHPVPLLFVCEDNGIGISTRSPAGWTERSLRSLPGLSYVRADGADPEELLATCQDVVARVRTERSPALLHLSTVRFMGHAGSDAEIAYRSERDITGDYARDPLLATAAALVSAGHDPHDLLATYERAREEVMETARRLVGSRRRLASTDDVVRPLLGYDGAAVDEQLEALAGRDRTAVFRQLPEDEPDGLTLAQAVNATLKDVLHAVPEAWLFGEDVAAKGGVYGVTRGLRRAFGGNRVFDTLLDEQTILGIALGSALVGELPLPEIQYLAYLHNAEDQLRGEAASLSFFSDGQYRNGMVIRIAGLAYQKGFGGHFHNDNSVAVLRDVPGIFIAVPSSAESAPGLLRRCVALARGQGKVCVFLEPIALYHEKDLHEPEDKALLARYVPPGADPEGTRASEVGRARLVEEGRDVLLVTFGNGVRMCRRARRVLAGQGVDAGVLDLQWLAPLPEHDIALLAGTARSVLVVDETRRAGGVAEAVLACLTDAGYAGPVARLNSTDSFVPLGPAADHVLVSEDQVIRAAHDLVTASRSLDDTTAPGPATTGASTP
jgi:2-oxoisovalerate dehydrogenase E1 component